MIKYLPTGSNRPSFPLNQLPF